MSKLNLYTNELLSGLREVQDPLSDQAVRGLMENQAIAAEINDWKAIPPVLPDHFPKSVVDFFQFYQSEPPNIDEKKVRISQKLFSSKGNSYLGLLGFYSLPYCYAFADGAQVLVRSKRIMEDQGRRLMETAGFVMECFRPGTFLEPTPALLVIAKVRLIHAFSRYFIELHDTSWQAEWGKPINQEDMIGTNLAFSYLVIRGFRKVNQTMDAEKVEALLHYWEIIGHYMGLDISFWPTTAKEAIYFEKLLRKRLMKYSEAGESLINSLIDHYKTTGQGPVVNFTETVISYFIGEQASASLKLKKKYDLPPSVFSSVLKFTFNSQGSKSPTFSKIEAEYHKIVREEYQGNASINIPVIPKRAEKVN